MKNFLPPRELRILSIASLSYRPRIIKLLASTHAGLYQRSDLKGAFRVKPIRFFLSK